MTLKVSRVDLWTVSIDDQAGGTADKLEPLSNAGANFEFVFARRTPEQPGRGMLFVTPVKGAKVVQAAQAAGFTKPENVHSVRIEGANKPGVTAKTARALANAGISFRALSATGIGSKFVSYVALDTAEDAGKAASLLKKLS
ncbi:MAG: amino acid-binding protein [Betaproteobacteria bacterium RIFCSPLOWO2_12_FULL_66_14]|nr:MAG: amino acid-binding protein [Betaproteobacteria bacterium RIFCSPLOWO2_12_FULL_66_14]